MARFGSIPTQLDIPASNYIRRNAGDTAFEAASDVMIDGDFGSQGIMLRGASAGVYAIIGGSSAIDTVEAALTNDATHMPTSAAVFAAIATAVGAEDFWDRAGTVLSPKNAGDDIQLDGNIYFDTKVTTAHVDKAIYWGDATDGWDTYIVEDADDRLRIYVGGTLRLTFDSNYAHFTEKALYVSDEAYPFTTRVDDASTTVQGLTYSTSASYGYSDNYTHFGGVYGATAVTPPNSNIWMSRHFIYDGSASLEVARIAASNTGTPAAGSGSGKINFYTRDTTGGLTERVNISSLGIVQINSDDSGSLQVDEINERVAASSVTIQGHTRFENSASNAFVDIEGSNSSRIGLSRTDGTNVVEIDNGYYAGTYAWFRLGDAGTGLTTTNCWAGVFATGELMIAYGLIPDAANGAYIGTSSLPFITTYSTTVYTNTITELITNEGVTIEGIKLEDSTLWTAAANMTFQDGTTGPHTLSALLAGTAPIDNILDWNGAAYAPYSAQTTGAFDSSTTNPISAVNRLNFDGEFYAYNLYAGNATDYITITSGGQIIIHTGAADQMIFQPYVSDGAGAYGYMFDTENTLSTEGSKVAVFKNNGTEVFTVYGGGQLLITERAVTGLPTPTASQGFIYMDSADDKLYFVNNSTTYDLTSTGGSATFIGLTDTPTDWTGGVGGFMVMVNSTPDAVEFIDPSGYAVDNFSGTLAGGGWTINATNTNYFQIKHAHATTGSTMIEMYTASEIGIIAYTGNDWTGNYAAVYCGQQTVNVAVEFDPNLKSIYISAASMLITDSEDSIGLQYLADYSTAGGTLGDRWIPDKGYVDSVAGGGMVWPDAGVAVSTGSAWGTSLVEANIVMTSRVNTYGDFAQIFKDNIIRINNPADTFYYTLTAGAITANRVLNIPVTGGPDTLMTLGLAQTVIATKTFTAAQVFYTGQRLNNPANTFYYQITTGAITANRTLNIPITTGTDTLMTLGLAQTVTGAKSFSTSALKIFNPAVTFDYSFASAAIAAARTITLPLLTGNDTMVTAAFGQTLTNKTMTLGSNTITGIKTQFNTACTDGDFMFTGDGVTATSYTQYDLAVWTTGTKVLIDTSGKLTFDGTTLLATSASSETMRIKAKNTSSGIAARADCYAEAYTPTGSTVNAIAMLAEGSGNTGTLFGEAASKALAIYAGGADPSALYIGISANSPIKFATNNIVRMELGSTGSISVWNSADVSERLTIAMNTDDYASIYHYDTSPAGYKILRLGSVITTGALLIDGATGFVGVGIVPATYTFRVEGTIYASGDITGNSDIRYKEVLGEIPFAWDDFMDITPIRYKSKLDKDSDPTFGFSAQEMMQHWNEPVSYDPATERYGMKYNAIIPINTTAIQKLKAEKDIEIAQLKKRVSYLESEVHNLKYAR